MSRHSSSKKVNGGRAIVGELIEQSRERLELGALKSGRDVAYSQDDLLQVERDVAGSVAIAAACLRLVAWKLCRKQVGPCAGMIADVKPIARERALQGGKWGRRNRLKILVPDTVSVPVFVRPFEDIVELPNCAPMPFLVASQAEIRLRQLAISAKQSGSRG